LKRLEAHGLISVSAPERGEGAAKHLVSLKPEGRRIFLEWIDEPTIGGPKLLHLEFLTRVSFARRIAPRRLNRILQSQIASILADIERIVNLRGDGTAKTDLETLSIEFRERQLRSALSWIEEIVIPMVMSKR
jgi:DNA-binding PadR family transcriptional regulator